MLKSDLTSLKSALLQMMQEYEVRIILIEDHFPLATKGIAAATF
jgi:hypothetical protein